MTPLPLYWCLASRNATKKSQNSSPSSSGAPRVTPRPLMAAVQSEDLPTEPPRPMARDSDLELSIHDVH